ncbi:MAG: hypothetical protein U0235_09375 [Polyangiaceae bacterium]
MMRTSLSFRSLAALLSITALAGCGEVQKAAAKDPMKCERDPDCVQKSGKSKDCATQCADNIDCMQRCQQIQRGTSP